MGTSILNIGTTGLAAAQAGLITTGHNIANAATPGYNRQQIQQSTNTPMFTGAGFLGQGTNVSAVQRVYNQFLGVQVASANTQAAQLATYEAEISQLDNLLADPSAGLSPALSEFFRTVGEVAANPASIPAREAMLSGAQALTARLRGIDARMTEVRDGINGQIQASVSAINTMAQQVAELNQRITLATASANGQTPNDLLDQRDQLIAELNKEIRVTTVTQSDGSFNVFIGNGQPLVVGTQTARLTATLANDDPTRVQVGYVDASGNTIRLQESLITGGHLGGLVAFRSETLDGAQNALGRIVAGLSMTFNAQHRLGQDLSGALGGDFFTGSTPVTLSSNTNVGTAQVSATITDAGALTASDYRVIANGAGNFTIMRQSDNVKLLDNGTLPASFDGVRFQLDSGSASAGDSFLVQPTRYLARNIGVAVADGRSIAAAAPLRINAADTNTGTAAVTRGEVTSTAGLTSAVPHIATPVTLTYDAAGAQFVLSGGTTGTLAYDAASATDVAGKTFTLAAVGGFRFAVSGVPKNGDAFVIESNDQGTADSRNAVALGNLQTTKTLIGGTASYQSSYAQLVAGVGNKSREVQVTLTAQENLARQASEAMQSISGVNLDEEAANLVRYQQAFQASAKVIDIASRLFDELLSLGR